MKLIFFALSALCIGALATKPPRWDPVHTVKGVLYIPYAEIEEPFEAWFDKHTNRSRIDYYGGTVKTYQLSKEGPYGTSLKIAPVTTNEKPNDITCLQVNGTADNQIDPQSILPDCRDFTLAGTEDLLGWKCDKFVYEETIGQKSNKYTMWVRYVKSPKYPSSRQPIPVRYEMRGYNTLLGSHYDHYHLDYNSYLHDDIPDDIFEYNQEDKPCVGFPGPGNGHYATFNPMKEFVHPADSSHVDIEHVRFMRKNGVVYATTEEKFQRQHVFMQNLRYIHSKNRESRGFSLTVNRLADRTQDELKALRGYKPSGVYNGGNQFPYELNADILDDLPDSYDWRLYGAVAPVKDQSVCGSCWSFGTTGAIEGAYFVQTGKLIRMSQQALVDCSWGYGNNGCDGGEDFRAYQWMKHVGGIPTEDSYGGYKGQDGFCHITDKDVKLVAPISGWVNVTSGDANAMKVALLKHGPISVAIDASVRTFSFYSNGVYYDSKCKNNVDGLDHAVLVVGYGIMNGEQYWLVKNSWSNLWGNDGYILMSARDNNCGVLTSPTYVTF